MPLDAHGNFSFATGLAADGSADGPHAVDLRATDRAGNATALLPVTVVMQAPVPEIDQFLAPDALRLIGVSTEGFNALTSPLTFELSAGRFYPGPDQVRLTVNGEPVAADDLTLSESRIVAEGALRDGINEISLAASDFEGRPLYLNTRVVAGAETLTVNLVTEDGQPLAVPATVEARLGDDQAFRVQVVSATGQVVFTNVPDRTILIEATAAGNLSGVIGVTGRAGTATLKLIGFDEPSAIDNNDVSQGTAGWEVGSGSGQVVPHEEGIPSGGVGSFAVSTAAGGIEIQAEPVDNDLVLGTTGEGEATLSRTFKAKQGTTSVKVRYRFITSEVPGGYFGSKYNDYFRVSIRSQEGGGSVEESNSMNGLGLSAFDFDSGATGWRERTLPVEKAGDTIQVDVAVANVGDGAFDSQVVVDFIEEKSCNIKPTIAWDTANGGLSLSYQVTDKPVEEEEEIKLYWASGSGFSDRIGDAFHTLTVAAGTAVGAHGPANVLGEFLKDASDETTHVIAACGEENVASLADVTLGYGAQANQGAVSALSVDVLKDLLRIAGRSALTINSTARSPEDQARAMFNNLVHPGDTPQQVQGRIAAQLALYAPPGDAVVNVFAQAAQGLTSQQILNNGATIRAAMTQEINNQGPSNVSRHCADPATLNVIDVGIGVGTRFLAAAQADGRVSNVLDEPNNGCYHLEIPQ